MVNLPGTQGQHDYIEILDYLEGKLLILDDPEHRWLWYHPETEATISRMYSCVHYLGILISKLPVPAEVRLSEVAGDIVSIRKAVALADQLLAILPQNVRYNSPQKITETEIENLEPRLIRELEGILLEYEAAGNKLIKDRK